MRRLPTRTCVACRTERQKRDLLRIVRAPDGTVTLDPSGKATGRGAYLCSDAVCWTLARRRRSIERALAVASSEALAAILAGGPPPAAAGGTHGA